MAEGSPGSSTRLRDYLHKPVPDPSLLPSLFPSAFVVCTPAGHDLLLQEIGPDDTEEDVMDKAIAIRSNLRRHP
jgi:hypothetical protein